MRLFPENHHGYYQRYSLAGVFGEQVLLETVALERTVEETTSERTFMPVKTLKSYLDSNRIKYVTIKHSKAYTAQEVAAAAHVSGRVMAKVVIMELDGDMAMAVLPANRKVVLQDLREVTGSDQVRFATEDKFKGRFPDCEIGAMPPFGNLYDMDVYAAECLAESEEIAFNAGSHEEVIMLAYADFERLVKPKVLSFTT